MLSKLKICNGNTFSSHQAPPANDHYGRTGRCEKLVLLSPAARTFIFQTLPSSHTLYMRLGCQLHISFWVVTMVQGKNFTFPFQASLLTRSAIKQSVPGVGPDVFLCVLKAWYYFSEGGSACFFQSDSSLKLQYYREQKLNLSLEGFFKHNEWGIPDVNCEICLLKSFSSTGVTFRIEEFRNMLSSVVPAIIERCPKVKVTE